jgi:hypothetical protein
MRVEWLGLRAALGGTFKLSKGSMKWKDARRRYRRGHDIPATHDVHHWGIEKNGSVAKQLEKFLGPDTKYAIVNHPANLNPIERTTHQAVHNTFGPLGRWWHGTPGWAKSAQGAAAAGAAGEAMKDCECR